MFTFKFIRAYFFQFFFFICWFAAAANTDTVTVQLKWKHQFQFAGYYAAHLKGFYKSENLYVKLKENHTNINLVDELISKRANFAVAGSDILLEYIKNRPVVALGAIYQHSPYVILSRKEMEITKPSDLSGKIVSAPKGQGLILLRSLLMREGISLDSVKIITPSRNPSLENKEVDAVTSYKLDKPARLKALGIETSVIEPSNYGVDFYGDILVTSKEEINEDPKRVQQFLDATLRGWEYALEHPQEISDYILQLPGVAKRGITKELLLVEAKNIKELIRPGLVEIGHMNKGRWENILKIYASQGLISKSKNLDDFLYRPEEEKSRYVKQLGIISIVLLLCALIFLVRSILIKHNLKKEKQKLVQADIKGKRSDEKINIILEHSGIILWNWNVATSEFTAYGHDNNRDFDTKDLNSIDDLKLLIHPDTLVKFDLFLSLLPDNFSGEVLMKTNKGYKWYLLTAKIKERDDNNNPLSFMGLISDISGLKAKEENLDKLTTELRKTNSELQKFAYITSHNLRRPIVNLDSLMDFYDYEAKDQTSNKEIVQKMNVSVNQLKNTLEDLLEVLSEKSDIVEFQSIDLVIEIGQLISKLKLDPSIKIEYDFSQIPQIYYPVKHFNKIFSNLILNSIKYKSPHKPLIIDLRSFEEGEYVALEITDNGIGIDLEKNKEKMFGLYQRFHPQIEGRGIGLFIIKSQIESLDGKIEVKSKLNLGTTFTVFFRKKLLK